jgi:hypothetical protein
VASNQKTKIKLEKKERKNKTEIEHKSMSARGGSGVAIGKKKWSRCTIASLHSSRLFVGVVCAVPPGSSLKNRRVVVAQPHHRGSFFKKEIKFDFFPLGF